MSIATSVGFGTLDATDYVTAVQKLRPDIAIALADIAPLDSKPSPKRVERMGDRTGSWLRVLVQGLRESQKKGRDDHGGGNHVKKTVMFAPILPLEAERQAYYLAALEDDYREDIAGFAVHDSALMTAAIPESMKDLPRMGFCEPRNPHELLRDIAMGVDVHTIPFVNALSDAGILLDFEFPAPKEQPTSSAGDLLETTTSMSSSPLPLATDLWSLLSDSYSSISPLKPSCTCYTCQNHHIAYMIHLLSAKEMLAWVLLQIHNHHVMDGFFLGVRDSLRDGSFEQDRLRFSRIYETDFPPKTGAGPRVRGYQVKSRGGGEPKKNALAFRGLGREKGEGGGRDDEKGG